jgi:TatD DNase family protein
VHPVDNEEKVRGIFDEKEFEKLVASPKVVAIGECGLDWFRMGEVTEEERSRQVKLFKQQIEFALKHDKPLMLHCRDSYSDVLDILEVYKKEYGEKLRGNSHFFAGSVKEAQRFFDIGFTVSFTGVITFTHDYNEVIKYAPSDMIMSETDAPFVAPVPYRGKRNEPTYVIEVVKRLAELKGVGEEEMAQITLQNARRLFGV